MYNVWRNVTIAETNNCETMSGKQIKKLLTVKDIDLSIHLV
jgi:hypothetical protein